MGIEGITGAGLTYQGSVSTAEMRAEAQPKVEAAEVAATSEKIAQDTRAIDTKNASGDGADDGGARQQQDPAAAQRSAQIKKAVEELNKKANNSEAIFGIHEGTNRVTIKLVDKDTKEVIKELPPEKTLDMIARVWEMAGIMVDERR